MWELRKPKEANKPDALPQKTETREGRTDAWEPRMLKGVNEPDALP